MADLKGAPLPPAPYANLMHVAHTSREFFLTFAQSAPTGGPNPDSDQLTATAHLVSRIVTSPAHAKAILHALELNIRKFEERFGEIRDDTNDERRKVQ